MYCKSLFHLMELLQEDRW